MTMAWSLCAKWLILILSGLYGVTTADSSPKILEGTGIGLQSTLQECVHDECNMGKGLGATPISRGGDFPKKILFWTSFFGIQDYEFGLGQQPFVDAGCPITNCLATTNKSEVNTSDAIVFHLRNVNSKTEFPLYRTPNQNWIFFLQESPMHQWNDLRRYNGIFNLTMTYRRDSDIQVMYGKVIQAVFGPQNNKESNTKSQLRKPFGEKKTVAWIVNDCKTHSKREDYVRELQKYIDVDIYGECGPLKCPKDETHTIRQTNTKCYQMLENEYKFYLSLENTFCQDYITEVFSVLKLNVVPIVMGGTDYHRDLPPESFINIMDYKSPKQLAAYLDDLGQDEKRYKQYFMWKSKYEVLVREARLQGFCNLCNLLNRPYPQTQVYEDMDKWWGKNVYCDNQVMQRLKTEW